MALNLHFPLDPRIKQHKIFYCSSSSSPQTLQQIKPNRKSVMCLSAANVISSSPVRRTGNYQQTIWDDSHIQSLPNAFLDEAQVRRWEELKVEVRELIGKQKSVVDRLELVDSLRQLGVSYHFEAEIKNVLSFICSSVESTEVKDNLHGTALFFRLLREHGLNDSQLSVDVLISCIKNESGSFKHNYDNDVKGMLSLYEASYVATEEEDELDEAREFAVKHLSNLRGSLLNPQVVEEIDHALELPLHWRMPRLHTRWFIEAYEKQEDMNPRLLELAKLDFNMVQSIYRQELKEMSGWWRNSGLVCDELSFARDRLVEHYFWTIGLTFEPQFGVCRKGVAKVNCFITTMDDIYDVYGTLDELEQFTKAVEEWKIDGTQELPNYMKTCLTSLFKTMDDISNTVSIEKGLDVLPYLKRAWVDLSKSYLMEARWYHAGCTPSLQEYLENAWVSISGALILTSAYCLSMDLTLESLNSFEFYPSFVRHSSLLLRLYDDLATATDEIQRGDVPKSIQCYIHEKNVSELVARDYIKCLIGKTWKELNRESTFNLKFNRSFKKEVMGVPRMAQCIYQYGDGEGKPGCETRERIISIVIEPIPF